MNVALTCLTNLNFQELFGYNQTRHIQDMVLPNFRNNFPWWNLKADPLLLRLYYYNFYFCLGGH